MQISLRVFRPAERSELPDLFRSRRNELTDPDNGLPPGIARTGRSRDSREQCLGTGDGQLCGSFSRDILNPTGPVRNGDGRTNAARVMVSPGSIPNAQLQHGRGSKANMRTDRHPDHFPRVPILGELIPMRGATSHREIRSLSDRVPHHGQGWPCHPPMLMFAFGYSSQLLQRHPIQHRPAQVLVAEGCSAHIHDRARHSSRGLDHEAVEVVGTGAGGR